MKDTYRPPHPHHRSRATRFVHERARDPYRSRRKLPEPTLCPHCRAVFHNGRWQWGEAPKEVSQTLCPACRRVRDDYPAGWVRLVGDFVVAHQDELVQASRAVEKREKMEHALNRIMRINSTSEGLLITTTEARLARAIGKALESAYQGELDFRYAEDGRVVHVTWTRAISDAAASAPAA